jgi:hypothetical protein
MGDTEGMKRPSRLRQPRLLRRDWVGDGILALLAGAVLVVALFLPWANEDRPGQVNYSLTMPDGINGILQTPWGTRALLLALSVVCLAAIITLTRPRRFSWVLGALVAACGGGVIAVAGDAASALGWWSPGLGMYLTVLAGVLLLPIGLAAALVGWSVARAARTPEPAPTAPPAPGSAPPS